MKPNELMIGDWVVYDGDVEYINPIRIEGIDTTGLCITSDRDDVGFDGVQPIPITVEILEKNGFIKQAFDGWMLRTENYSIMWRIDYGEPNLIIDSWSAAYGTFNKFGISFVHELQHALRLCNIDKEIEL